MLTQRLKVNFANAQIWSPDHERRENSNVPCCCVARQAMTGRGFEADFPAAALAEYKASRLVSAPYGGA